LLSNENLEEFDFQALFENCPCMMGIVEIKDDDVIHLRENKEVIRLIGRTSDHHSGKSTGKDPGTTKEILDLWRTKYLKSRKDGVPVSFQYWRGETFLSVVVSPLMHPKKDNLYSYIIQDLTEFKKNQLSLREKETKIFEIESRSQVLFEHAAAGIAEVSDEGKFIRVNKKFCEITGHDEKELMALTFQEITHPDDLSKDISALKRLYLYEIDSYEMDKRYIKKDKSIVWIHLTVSLVEVIKGKKQYAIAIIQDINDKKELEQRMYEAGRRIEMITETIPNFIWICEPDGSGAYFNTRWLEYTGQSVEEASGKGWHNAIHPLDRELVLEDWKITLNLGEPSSIQYRLMDLHGHYKWFLTHSVAVKNNSGEVIQWLSSSADIDDEKKAHQTIEEAVVLRDEFLLMASHELKTPVTSIKMHLQMLQNKIQRMDGNRIPVETAEYINIAHKQSSNLAHLVENLLDISRVKLGKMGFLFDKTNLSNLIEDIVYHFEATTNRSTCTIESSVEKDIYCFVDKIKIEQVLINLLMNSLKYAAGSMVRVVLRATESEVIIQVSDSGPGIPSERRETIFDKFTRGLTHRNVSGLGLGLFISRQIIENHSGTLVLEENANKGTYFKITLPL
jgi:PAS domain S-box-containing protein